MRPSPIRVNFFTYDILELILYVVLSCKISSVAFLSSDIRNLFIYLFIYQSFPSPSSRLIEESSAYEKLCLANLLELREECLREFQFRDAYISIIQRLVHIFFQELVCLIILDGISAISS